MAAAGGTAELPGTTRPPRPCSSPRSRPCRQGRSAPRADATCRCPTRQAGGRGPRALPRLATDVLARVPATWPREHHAVADHCLDHAGPACKRLSSSHSCQKKFRRPRSGRHGRTSGRPTPAKPTTARAAAPAHLRAVPATASRLRPRVISGRTGDRVVQLPHRRLGRRRACGAAAPNASRFSGP